MKKTFIIVTFFITAATVTFAQKEAHNWYFGDRAGLKWKTTRTLPTYSWLPNLPDTLGGSAMANQLEGVFTMSDAAGNLLFYSDGMTVWNKNHQVMTNGSGLTGGNSSTQSGIVVPYMGHPNQYLVFTVKEALDPPYQAAYSIIDMTQSSGFGAVTTKNVLLTGAYGGSLMEQIAAVRIPDGSGYWIVIAGHGNPAFLNVWKVSTTGTLDVTFQEKYQLSAAFSIDAIYGVGYLRFSTKGNYFALATYPDRNLFFGEFNPVTGKFSTSPIKRITYPTNTAAIYGLEFSSSGKILYATDYGTHNQPSAYVYAYKFEDLLALGDVTANGSVPHRSFGTYTNPCALQLGPDGRIYGVLRTFPHMLVLDNVEDYANVTCTQVNNLLASGMTGLMGLPNFLGSYFEHLSVTAVNDIVKFDPNTLLNPNTATVNVLANDNIPAGDTISDFTILIPPAHGSYTVLANNNITYTPAQDFTGRDSLQYRFCINPVSCDSAWVFFDVFFPVYRFWYISSPYFDSNPRVFEVYSDTLGGKAGSMLGYYSEEQKQYTKPFYTYNFADNAYFEAGRGIVASLDTTIAAFNPPTVNIFKGGGYGTTFNADSVKVAVTHTDTVAGQSAKRGKNLLGNPYLNYIDFDLFYAYNSAVINNTLWIRGYSKTSRKMTYDTYNANGTGTGNINGTNLDGKIPPVQGFWVHANTSDTVTFKAGVGSGGHEIPANLSQLLRAPAVETDNYPSLQNRIARIKVSAGKISDETVIVFNPQASNAYDAFDSEKMSNGEKDIPELYTTAAVETDNYPSLQMAINGMQPVTNELYLPLGFRTGQQNTFSISGKFENWNTQVILRDNQTGAETDLTAGNVYSFASDSVDNTSRFTLKINGNMTEVNNTVNDNNVAVYVNENNRIVVLVETDNYPSLQPQPATAQVFNTIGQKLHEQTLNSQFSILNFQLNAGVYLVKVGNKTERVIIK